MDSKTVEHSSEEDTATQKGKARLDHDTSAEHAVDKFADAKRAKKKQKRAKHRARLRRPHTSG
jgi:hypothetical protein